MNRFGDPCPQNSQNGQAAYFAFSQLALGQLLAESVDIFFGSEVVVDVSSFFLNMSQPVATIEPSTRTARNFFMEISFRLAPFEQGVLALLCRRTRGGLLMLDKRTFAQVSPT